MDSVTIAKKAISFGAMQKEKELAELLEIIKKKQPKTILEIGTFKGGSFFAFSQAAPNNAVLIGIEKKFNAFSNAIDVLQHAIEGFFKHGFSFLKKNLSSASYVKAAFTPEGSTTDFLRKHAKPGQKLFFVGKNSISNSAVSDVKKILSGKKIDFLFIDGNHEFEAVKKDFELYSPLVAKHGIIAFHDIFLKEELLQEVYKLWAVLRKKKSFKAREIADKKEPLGIGILEKLN